MTTKNKFSEDNFNATIGNSLEFRKKLKNVSDSEYRRLREAYDDFLEQPLKLEMFVPCDEDGNVLEEPKIEEEYVDEHTTQIFAQYQYDLDKAKEKVLFEGFKIYDYKLNVFFYLGRRKKLSYDKKRKDFITIGFLPETVEDLINISSQIKLSQTALNAIFG